MFSYHHIVYHPNLYEKILLPKTVYHKSIGNSEVNIIDSVRDHNFKDQILIIDNILQHIAILEHD